MVSDAIVRTKVKTAEKILTKSWSPWLESRGESNMRLVRIKRRHICVNLKRRWARGKQWSVICHEPFLISNSPRRLIWICLGQPQRTTSSSILMNKRTRLWSRGHMLILWTSWTSNLLTATSWEGLFSRRSSTSGMLDAVSSPSRARGAKIEPFQRSAQIKNHKRPYSYPRNQSRQSWSLPNSSRPRIKKKIANWRIYSSKRNLLWGWANPRKSSHNKRSLIRLVDARTWSNGSRNDCMRSHGSINTLCSIIRHSDQWDLSLWTPSFVSKSASEQIRRLPRVEIWQCKIVTRAIWSTASLLNKQSPDLRPKMHTVDSWHISSQNRWTRV